VHVTADNYTAQAIIITDAANNQITAFHPGAMMQAHETGLPARDDIALAIIGPDGRDAMMRRARDLAAAKIPFVFDPGQGLPMFDGDDLRTFVAQASWVTVNDYEAKMLTERLGTDLAALSRSHLKGVVVTLGDQGCEVWVQGERTHVPGVPATAVVDPTGCGDAYRAGLVYGLERALDWETTGRIASLMGAIKIATVGTQHHRFTMDEFRERFHETFGYRLD